MKHSSGEILKRREEERGREERIHGERDMIERKGDRKRVCNSIIVMTDACKNAHMHVLPYFFFLSKKEEKLRE